MISYGWRSLTVTFCEAIRTTFFLEDRHGNLATSPAFAGLVQSEKSTATYWLAMALTKLTAEKRLRVPWLCHLERLLATGAAELTAGTAERGDLAGKDSRNRWHVLEAKGRSYNVASTVIDEAKSQASRVTSVNGVKPSTTSSCIARFFTVPISIDLEDPDSQDPGSEASWLIDQPRWFIHDGHFLSQRMDSKAEMGPFNGWPWFGSCFHRILLFG